MTIWKWIFRTPFGSLETFTSIEEVLLHGAMWGFLGTITFVLLANAW